MHVVICGGGVIGASIAYFLSCRGAEVTVVERSAVACAASGKAGGFLAFDWCDHGPLESLARRSFTLHARLHEELSGSWGYRRLDGYGGSGSRGPKLAATPYKLGWVSDRVALDCRLGSTATTAQVHPAAFTAAMVRAAEAQGAKLILGTVT